MFYAAAGPPWYDPTVFRSLVLAYLATASAVWLIAGPLGDAIITKIIDWRSRLKGK